LAVSPGKIVVKIIPTIIAITGPPITGKMLPRYHAGSAKTEAKIIPGKIATVLFIFHRPFQEYIVISSPCQCSRFYKAFKRVYGFPPGDIKNYAKKRIGLNFGIPYSDARYIPKK
jgi:hypothetical protein